MDPEEVMYKVLIELEARVEELEAKLKIAVENAAQAVKERDILQREVFNLKDSRDEAKNIAEQMIRYIDANIAPGIDPKLDRMIERWLHITDKEEEEKS